MCKTEVKKRLALLRQKMQEKGLDYYLIPTADYHHSEYVSDYFKAREFFSGFTGSSGCLLVWQDGAGLWTDGRYFIQAAAELEGTDITLFKMGEEGVPALSVFLKEKLRTGEELGVDGRVLTAEEGLRFEQIVTSKGGRLQLTEDMYEDIWPDRPGFPCGPVSALPIEFTGKSVADKLNEIRLRMEEEGADGLFISKLDHIMWCLNIRGCDVACNPVAMSYFYLTRGEAVVFLADDAVSENVKKYLLDNMIRIRDYAEVRSYLENLQGIQSIWLDKEDTCYTFFKIFNQNTSIKVIERKDPVQYLKAVKNPVELLHMRDIYLKDSVAVTKFIYWLKNRIGKEEITEISAADYLERCRHDIPEFCGLSFPTIAGYGANAAMMHYEATPEKHAVLKQEGMLLVDSGGQYMGGTTDVTRTIVLGEITPEMKKHYTAVAAGMLELTNAVWLHGCTGRNLDILARRPLWELGLDYKCGTGHGVGYMLNVHEGPHNIRWRYAEGMSETVLEPGMDVTNEPGVYIEGSHGIRIENVLVVKNINSNEYGRFLGFETLTWVPLDMGAVDRKQLTEKQWEYLTAYQHKVYEKLSPYLTEAEKNWLRNEISQM